MRIAPAISCTLAAAMLLLPISVTTQAAEVGDIVVVTSDTQLQAGSNTLATVREGTAFEVHQVNGGWLLAHLEQVGWIRGSSTIPLAHARDHFSDQLDDLVKNRQVTQSRSRQTLSPKALACVFALANVAYHAGDYPSAYACLSDCLASDPKSVPMLTQRGNASWKLGEHARAVRDYREAIEVDSNAWEPRAGLAWVLATSRDKDIRDGETALREARRAVELSKSQMPSALLALAAAQASTGDVTAAQQTLAGVKRDRAIQSSNYSALAKALSRGEAFIADQETNLVLRIRQPDGAFVKMSRLVKAGWKSTWSPDGKQIAYGLPGATHEAGIEVLDLATGQTRRITERGKDPFWSPDGRHIAYVRFSTEEASRTGQFSQEEVWTVTPDGQNNRRVDSGTFPCWSADGKTLYFTSRTKRGEVHSVDIDRAEMRAKTVFSNSPSGYNAVSPNGRLVSYGDRGTVYIADITTGETLTNFKIPGLQRGVLGTWSRDSQRIAFGGFDLPLSGVWIYDVQERSLEQIVQGRYTLPSWTLDEKRLAVDLRSRPAVDSASVGEVWLVSLAGDDQTAPLLPIADAPPIPADPTGSGENQGKIVEVAGQTIVVQWQSPSLPKPGDRLTVFVEVPGVGRASVASASVTSTVSTSIEAKIDRATGSIKPGQIVLIDADP